MAVKRNVDGSYIPSTMLVATGLLSDSADLTVTPAIGIYAGAAGNVAFDDEAGNSVIIPVSANQTLICRMTRIRSTGTTVAAASIWILY